MADNGSRLEACVGLSHDVMRNFCSQLDLAAQRGGLSSINHFLPPSASTLMYMERLRDALFYGSATSDELRLTPSDALLGVSRSFIGLGNRISFDAFKASGMSPSQVRGLSEEFLELGAHLYNSVPAVPRFLDLLAGAVAFKQHVLEDAQSILYCLAIQALHNDTYVEASHARVMIEKSMQLRLQDK